MSDQELIRMLIEIRKQIHARPEVSGQELNTAATVARWLKAHAACPLMTQLGGHGILATIDSGREGPEVLFRAELDALPIQEINTFPHRSEIDGVSHKCGHDGHLVTLLGLAARLKAEPPARGKVHLLFQPAEENGEGARAVLADERFAAIQPDFVFAYHNLPGYPLGQVVTRGGSFTAAVKSMVIELKGKTAHAAEPENGINPALAIAEMLTESDKLSNNDPARQDFTLITPVHIEMGEVAYGISAGYGVLRLTIRTWTEEVMQQLEADLINVVQAAGLRHGIDIDYSWTQVFSANENDGRALAYVTQSTAKLGLPQGKRDYPFKWGEDFGLFTQQFKGAMFGIGSGEGCLALHNPDYDFPDEILPTAVSLFHEISREVLA